MKIDLYTGHIPMYGLTGLEHHQRTGGVLRELAVHIRRFLDLYEYRDNVSLTVCTTGEIWQKLIEEYSFIVNPSVKFLDYKTVLEKQGLEKNIYWYDALRFQILSTIVEEEKTLAYWIDEDALIQNPGLLDFCTEYKEYVISPKDRYPWDRPEKQSKLLLQSSVFSRFDLDMNPQPDSYTNTGTFFGGPARLVKIASNYVLQLEKAFETDVQPSAEVLEYVSCYSVQELCRKRGIPYLTLDLNCYIWHYTGYRLPVTTYIDVLWKNFPEDIDLMRDFCDSRTEKFRINYIHRVFSEILENRILDSKYLWEDLAVEEYSKLKKRRSVGYLV